MADSLRDLLAAQGYEVHTAYGGAEGIRALEERGFSVVITDLRMQEVDGLEVIRRIHEMHPSTLVIVITGYASTDSAIQALHFQAFDYLRKPFEFDLLRSAVERAFHKIEVEQLKHDTAAMITHDIKVPLTTIIGFAAMMQDKDTGKFHPRAEEFAETIRVNGQKMLALIDNYLMSCRAEAGKLSTHPRQVHLREFAEGLTAIYGTEAQRRGFEVNMDLSGAPESAVFDESLLFRAVGNLLQNAIKYGNPSEPICLCIRRENLSGRPALCFEVVNLAPGLQPESLPELFGRFKRAAISSGVEGSGIGLYVVDAVARTHGGTAEARCLDGGRVAFSITIP